MGAVNLRLIISTNTDCSLQSAKHLYSKDLMLQFTEFQGLNPFTLMFPVLIS